MIFSNYDNRDDKFCDNCKELDLQHAFCTQHHVPIPINYDGKYMKCMRCLEEGVNTTHESKSKT